MYSMLTSIVGLSLSRYITATIAARDIVSSIAFIIRFSFDVPGLLLQFIAFLLQGKIVHQIFVADAGENPLITEEFFIFLFEMEALFIGRLLIGHFVIGICLLLGGYSFKCLAGEFGGFTGKLRSLISEVSGFVL